MVTNKSAEAIPIPQEFTPTTCKFPEVVTTE